MDFLIYTKAISRLVVQVQDSVLKLHMPNQRISTCLETEGFGNYSASDIQLSLDRFK